MPEIIETLLLLALPASGKSEVRKYLDHLAPETRRRDLHLGPTVQLDDFPYVHLMRRVDDELAALGKPRVYFHSGDRPFKDPRDWATLIHLVNEDYGELTGGARPQVIPAGGADRAVEIAPAAGKLLGRLETASGNGGIGPRLARLEDTSRRSLARALEKDAGKLEEGRKEAFRRGLDGATLVIEFARGGPRGSTLPFPEPFGYRYSLSRLAAPILEKAAILYVWVTPEESRRKNEARADPDDPGSILHHSVPPEVMGNDYGLDDMDWLERSSSRPGTVTVEAHGTVYHLPVARFDNRVDKTSFLRGDSRSWKPEQVQAVHTGLKSALDRLLFSRSGAGA